MTIQLLRRIGVILACLGAFACAPVTSGVALAIPPIYDETGNCIHYVTNLGYSTTGPQFIVRSTTADKSAANAVASDITANSILQTYEKGLNISSLLQSGETTLPLVNGTHPFPIFIDPGLDPDLDGVFAPLCQHPTWGSLVISAYLSSDALAATAAHELFHAAQFAFLGELATPGPNWWFEATAVTAETWFGTKDAASYDSAVINHPDKRMDAFGVNGLHPYGAYRFVQWVLGSSAKPDVGGWAFLRDSFNRVRTQGPTQGVDTAVKAYTGSDLPEEVATFWGNHTDPKPKFGKTAPLEPVKVNQPAQKVSLTPEDYLAATLVKLQPNSTAQQVEIVVHKLPADVELLVNNGDGALTEVKPGDGLDELFCRNGYLPASYPLPSTGDVRLTLATTGKTPPGTVDVRVLTTKTNCPHQLAIVPGFEIGQLHLGMSMKEAATAAKLSSCGTKRTVGPYVVQICTYIEAPKDFVVAGYLNGNLSYLAISTNRAFATTTGIETWGGTGKLIPTDDGNFAETIPGSTADDFASSAPGVSCQFDGQSNQDEFCYYQESKGSRYTFAAADAEKCDADEIEDGVCFWPQPDYYVGAIGVAKEKAFNAVICYEYGVKCPSGSQPQ